MRHHKLSEWFLFILFFSCPYNDIIMYVQTNTVCGQDASVLQSTSITLPTKQSFMDLQGQSSFSVTVKLMDHSCTVKNVQLLLFYLFFWPSCLMCLLFLKWCLFTNLAKINTRHLFCFLFFSFSFLFLCLMHRMSH